MKKKLNIFLLVLFIFVAICIVSYNVFIKKSFDNAIPILAYHDVLENPKFDTDISIKNFEKQMKYLYDNGYKTLSLDELYEWKKGKEIVGKKVIITFDDGKESFYTTVAPILEKYDMKAIVFVVGSYLNTDGYLSYEQIEKIVCER